MGLSLKERLPQDQIAPCDGGEIYMYRIGGLSMSVCAPGHLGGEQVAKAVERYYPCGTEGGWQLSPEDFRTGEKNGCQCQETPDRRHWYIDC